jgi:hypothetical protein
VIHAEASRVQAISRERAAMKKRDLVFMFIVLL